MTSTAFSVGMTDESVAYYLSIRKVFKIISMITTIMRDLINFDEITCPGSIDRGFGVLGFWGIDDNSKHPSLVFS
jgi:hypothetical protein